MRSCEGALKKRSRCLQVSGADALALTATPNINCKLMLRRAPEQVAQPAQPRAFVRVANRGTGGPTVDSATVGVASVESSRHEDLEPFLQHLQNDVARLSRAFASLGREANALVRQEAQAQATIRNANRAVVQAAPPNPTRRNVEAQLPEPAAEDSTNNENGHLSRNARRRLRKRLRGADNNPVLNLQVEAAGAATAATASFSQNPDQLRVGFLRFEPERHRHINNSAPHSQRQTNNNASQPQRQVNNSAPQSQRPNNNSAPQPQRQINNTALQSQRQANNSAAQSQRQNNNSAHQPQRQSNNSAAQQQRRQPVNNVNQEQPQQARAQPVQTEFCPLAIVAPVEAPSGSNGGPSQNDNRPRSNKKKRPQQHW